MTLVVWEDIAADELDSIFRDLSRVAPEPARRLVNDIYAATQMLETFLRMGRPFQEANIRDHRELIVHNYRVVYRVKGDVVTVVAVRHGVRRLGDIPSP